MALSETFNLLRLSVSLSLPRYITAFLLCLACGMASATTCKVVPDHVPTEAESAFRHSDYDRAVSLYKEQLQTKPDDPALTAALSEVLLRQQKVQEADDTIKKALVK